MYLFSFEKLDLWKDARSLAKMAYAITDSFPNSEKYGLMNQMNRAAVSVASNIAEGSARIKSKDKVRFLHIAFGSLMEFLNQLIIADDFGWVNQDQFITTRNQIEMIAKKINALEKAWIKQNNI